MKNLKIIAIIVIIIVGLAIIVSTNRKKAVNQRLEGMGVSQIQLEQQIIGSCCGFLKGCKNYTVYEYTGIQKGIPVHGRACYRNCIWGEKVSVCEGNT